MAKRIYVGNLSYRTNEDSLRQLFGGIGEVVSVKIITDESGRSKGFGFVEMNSDEEAVKAISSLNGTSLDGRDIAVNEARPQTERGRQGGPGKPRKSFGGGGRESGKWR
jgi:cold-inducible RNA-binding protein